MSSQDTIQNQSTQIAFIEARENRAWCKERGIRISGPPLGRPPATISKETKKPAREDERIRQAIEGNTNSPNLCNSSQS